MASLLKCSSGRGSVLFDSLMEMAGSVADVRGTFRLEFEFSELDKRLGASPLPTPIPNQCWASTGPIDHFRILTAGLDLA